MILKNLPDAHAHIGTKEEVEERLIKRIPTIINGATPEEIRQIQMLREEESNKEILIPSYGIHPWHADQYQFVDFEQFFEQCDIIGEIGMDNVWSNVPEEVQRTRFIQQITYGSREKKPVILHTKGKEKEIVEIIASYPNRYLVHWYADKNYLEEYIKLDCYFSIGPDVFWNPIVQQVAKQIPLERLLIETDGMSAVTWAHEENSTVVDMCHPDCILSSLEQTRKTIATVRDIEESVIDDAITQNFWRFVNA